MATAIVRSGPQRPSGGLSSGRGAIAGLLVLVYAAPLFWPPAPVPIGTVVAPDAWLLARIFPGVPALWVGIRLAALAVAAVLLSKAVVFPERGLVRPAPPTLDGRRGRVLRLLALVVALLHAASAPWASRLGPFAQSAYVLLLFAPALLLVAPGSFRLRVSRARACRAAPVAALILVWTGLRLASDPNSPQVADAPDCFRAFVILGKFLLDGRNLLTDPIETDMPAFGSVGMFLYGLPLFQSGLVPLSLRWVQIVQILTLAATAAGVAVLARMLVGGHTSLVAVAVFLFAPYTRFLTLNSVVFQIGPVYSTSLALCALAACRWRSEAALAALGACSGLAVTYPSTAPVAACFLAWTAWSLRPHWRRVWIGGLAALGSFAAVVIPGLPSMLVGQIGSVHLSLGGVFRLYEAALMGQMPVGAFDIARAILVWRPFDIVVAALIAPFAHFRAPIRSWGDGLFDPIGALLMAVGLVSCCRCALRSSTARVLLVFLLAALSLGFISLADQVDMIHALGLPVPVALLAAAGFLVVRSQLRGRCRNRQAATLAAALIAAAGMALFDLVNPRILHRSSLGIMFRIVQPEALDRLVVLNYPKAFSRDVKWLYTGAITQYAPARPVGYLEYGGDTFPALELAAEGKDLLFWSPGLNQDLKVADAVCVRWPDATLYEIWDAARIGRTYAARIGDRGWEPAAPAGRWQQWTCGSEPRHGQ